ncbi:MAG: hypothetical protein GOP50_06980 [Candidatus Heimdallarchaeota archaeon]|nr:hypothetical protein [Candidatus Heimdallarchaeota archaeon]
MSESPKEKNQTFTDFVSLAKKIEEIVDQTPDKKQEDKFVDENLAEHSSESQQILIPHKKELVEVEQQTLKLEESISGVAEKTGVKFNQKKMEDLVRIEKELIELYSGAKIQISDFYYKQEEKREEDIINGIKSKLQSIDKITVKKKETLGLPFALCKLKGKYQAVIPIEIDKIKLPTLMIESSKNFKLLHVSDEEMLNLSENEKKVWNQAFTRFQIKLTQLISSRAKENLSKSSPKMKLVTINASRIQQYIKEYEEKLSNLQNYQQEILDHLHDIKELIIKENSFWKNDDEFLKAKQELKKQLIEFEEKQKKVSRESQVEFIKLKRIQKKLDARTKKFKLDEKRNKKIPREEKEQLIKEVREFQSKKIQLQESIEHTKRMEETLKRWVEIISNSDMDQVNKMMMENYSEGLIEKIHSFTENQDVGSILEDSVLVNSDLEDLVIHVIYIPTTFYTFKAKQGDKTIEGKAIFLSPTQEIVLLNPAVV